MTLIASYITKFGIIQASDSNLTDDKGNAGFGQKIFPIPHYQSSLAYSGCYTINGINADSWINEFITGSVHSTSTLEEFCSQITTSLNSSLREHEFKVGTIIHIAGYLTKDGLSYIQHWHISNTGLDPQTGLYSTPADSFHLVSDFDSLRVAHHRELLKSIDSNPTEHQFYINGFPPGRISAVIIKHHIDHAFAEIWNNPNWKFKEPKSIFEFSHLVRIYFQLVINLFPMSEYNALYVGGDIQINTIPTPQNLNLTP